MRDALWVLRDKKIAVWGLTFKPDTDDMRSSVAIELVAEMLREGAQVTAYDPKGMEKAREVKSIAGARLTNTALEAVEGAEALILATEWAEFANVDLETVRERMHTPLIFDGRNLFDPETMRKLGFHYTSIGRPAGQSCLTTIRLRIGCAPSLHHRTGKLEACLTMKESGRRLALEALARWRCRAEFANKIVAETFARSSLGFF